jgi:hypothetical protein
MSVPPNDNTGLNSVSSNESLLDLPPVQVPGTTEAHPAAASPEAAPPVTQQGAERNPELLPTQPSNQDQPGQLPQPAAAPAAATPAPTADPQATAQAVPTPQIADDVDLIEKEWIEKAKSIVAKTKADPHAQNQELNQVKADYIKQRFNKELRTK